MVSIKAGPGGRPSRTALNGRRPRERPTKGGPGGPLGGARRNEQAYPRPGASPYETGPTPSSSHHRQPTLMFPPGEAPARRAPLHPAVAVTLANQRRCFIPEGKHQLDEYHCITRQYSPSPTNTDASSPRRSTSSTSTTASPSSSHLRQPTPMLASRGEAPARRAPLHPPAAVTFANQRRCFLPEAEHPLGEPHCITQQQSPSS